MMSRCTCCGGFSEEDPIITKWISDRAMLLKSLKEIVAIADRKTHEFDRAKAAIANAEGFTPPKSPPSPSQA